MSDDRKDGPSSDDAFDAEERRALDAWTVPDAQPGLADRVLAARAPVVEDEEEDEGGGWRKKRGVALVAGAAAVLAVVFLTDQSATGDVETTARQTVAIGSRAIAVAEADSAIAWNVGRRGDAVIDQVRGNVFYRVEKGGLFLVRVGDVKVRVVGTSFRVEVSKMNSKKAMALGAGAGALVAATVTVTVYEGRVVSASPNGKVTLEAGEAAVVVDGLAPTKVRPALSSRPTVGAATSPRGATEAEPVVERTPGASTPAELARLLADTQAENVALRAKLEQKEAALDEANAPRKFFDPSPQSLQSMADDCAIAWDTVSTGVTPPTVPDEAMAQLELSEEEREIVNAKMKESHDALKDDIRRAYTQVTGDSNTGSLATEAMFAEINDKTSLAELRRIFMRLSHERAGRSPPAANDAAMTPAEQLYRAVTSSGDRLEAAIAEEIGPEQARRIRGHRDGWNSKSRSSNGCPK